MYSHSTTHSVLSELLSLSQVSTTLLHLITHFNILSSVTQCQERSQAWAWGEGSSTQTQFKPPMNVSPFSIVGYSPCWWLLIFPFIGRWARRWINHCVCDAWQCDARPTVTYHEIHDHICQLSTFWRFCRQTQWMWRHVQSWLPRSIQLLHVLLTVTFTTALV